MRWPAMVATPLWTASPWLKLGNRYASALAHRIGRASLRLRTRTPTAAGQTQRQIRHPAQLRSDDLALHPAGIGAAQAVS
jgi:hypothetical protein